MISADESAMAAISRNGFRCAGNHSEMTAIAIPGSLLENRAGATGLCICNAPATATATRQICPQRQ
jgi:hypothetical protein